MTTRSDSVLGAGMAFPPRIGAEGRFERATGAEHVRQSIRIILLTERGERLMRPGFGAGLGRLLFEPNTVATRRLIQERIEQALARHERRIRLNAVTVEADPNEPRAAIATIAYTLIATGAGERTAVRIELAGD